MKNNFFINFYNQILLMNNLFKTKIYKIYRYLNFTLKKIKSKKI